MNASKILDTIAKLGDNYDHLVDIAIQNGQDLLKERGEDYDWDRACELALGTFDADIVRAIFEDKADEAIKRINHIHPLI